MNLLQSGHIWDCDNLYLNNMLKEVLVSYPKGVIQGVNCEVGAKGEYGRGSKESGLLTCWVN